MPRLALERVTDLAAVTAARIVRPSGTSAACSMAGAIARPAATSSVWVRSGNSAFGCTLPGLAAEASRMLAAAADQPRPFGGHESGRRDKAAVSRHDAAPATGTASGRGGPAERMCESCSAGGRGYRERWPKGTLCGGASGEKHSCGSRQRCANIRRTGNSVRSLFSTAN
jgi:hypothetical protein